MTVCLEKSMQEVIEVTSKQAALRAQLRESAKLIGESMIRVAANGCALFDKEDYAQHVNLAGPGLLNMVLDMADKEYTTPVVEELLVTQAVAFFELGMTRALEQAKDEGLSELFF